jgi:ABC-type branched-subunit amino acid transport system ATPase component
MMLSLVAVSAGYGGAVVNRAVTFDVDNGEIVSLIGRNGVGKTTLAKTIIGLQRAVAGAITFDGRDITRLDAGGRARLGIGYVPQGRGIFGDMTVEENLKMGRLIGGSPRPLEYAFELFPILKERRHQLGGTLSGGQQQMLSIGRVLIGSPKMLLLDEPSDGIQPNIVEQIGALCQRLNVEMGMTILLIEQNLDLITSCAQRCLIMEKGRITGAIDPKALDDPDVAKRALAI